MPNAAGSLFLYFLVFLALKVSKLFHLLWSCFFWRDARCYCDCRGEKGRCSTRALFLAFFSFCCWWPFIAKLILLLLKWCVRKKVISYLLFLAKMLKYGQIKEVFVLKLRKLPTTACNFLCLFYIGMCHNNAVVYKCNFYLIVCRM